MKKFHFLLFLLLTFQINAQNNSKINDFFKSADTLDKKRLWMLNGAVFTTYAASIALLNKVWYSQYPRSGFHYFNDYGEWENQDKFGHMLTAYTETKWMYEAYRWTGMKNRNAALVGMAAGTFFQGCIETLDGFSAGWGFSWSDVAFNTSGCALFGIQQALWNDQRMVLKVGNFPKKYSKDPIKASDGSFGSLHDRAIELFGDNYTQSFFKDYNALNWWLSINPASFSKSSKFPAWLNIAVGYSAENVFGAYGNVVYTKSGQAVSPDPSVYPRYRQYMLSLDIDLSRIKVKNKVLKAFLHTFNFIKIPAPAIEYNSLGKFKFHPFIF